MRTLEVLEVEQVKTRAVEILSERTLFAVRLTDDFGLGDAVRTLALIMPDDEDAQEEWFEQMRCILDLADVSRQEIAAQYLAALLLNRIFARGERRYRIAQYISRN